MTLSPTLLDLLRAALYGALACTFAAVNALFLVWLERKVSARIQLRRGPMRGPFGLLQTLFDAVKLLSKELTTPRYASRFLFVLAPVLVFAPVVVSFLVIPFAPGMPLKDLNVGFLLIFAMSSVTFIGFFTAGWASNNKYAALGSLRAVAQNISYEVPLLLSVMGVVLLSGTLQMSQIVAAQTHLWYIVLQPVAFLIFLCAMLGETNRAPFDIPEAESELVAGFHTEYSGFRFAVFFLTEYTNVFLGSALATALFLGGWHGPLIHPAAWFLLKTYGVVFVVMWIRWTFPRLRSDQLINFGWKYLIPFGLLNVLVTALAMALIGKAHG